MSDYTFKVYEEFNDENVLVWMIEPMMQIGNNNEFGLWRFNLQKGGSMFTEPDKPDEFKSVKNYVPNAKPEQKEEKPKQKEEKPEQKEEKPEPWIPPHKRSEPWIPPHKRQGHKKSKFG